MRTTGLWCHRKCVLLTGEQFTDYATRPTEEYFVCPSCAKDPGGAFDWDRSLQRYVFRLHYINLHFLNKLFPV